AALKSVETENDLADFSDEKPAQSVRDLAKLDVDLGKWKQTLRTTSDLFRGDPSLETSSAMLNFRVLNRYFVNTEGTVARSGKTIYTLLFSGSDQADDGMHLERSHGWVVTRTDELPKEYEHQSLAGSYDVDDEGVEAQKVTVIDKGMLTNYLLGRQPIRDFPHSNGHGRTALAGAPRPQISNLIFKAEHSISADDLKKK